MIVLGADTHKSSHTIAAIDAVTGQLLADKTIEVGARGFGALVLWARGLGGERVWALEDCRHVSGALERFLIGRGERVVRVSTRLMAGTRRSSRDRGKSDQIDAMSVARAALAAGIETLPTAALAGRELEAVSIPARRGLEGRAANLIAVDITPARRWHGGVDVAAPR
jgi:transposase